MESAGLCNHPGKKWNTPGTRKGSKCKDTTRGTPKCDYTAENDHCEEHCEDRCDVHLLLPLITLIMAILFITTFITTIIMMNIKCPLYGHVNLTEWNGKNVHYKVSTK